MMLRPEQVIIFTKVCDLEMRDKLKLKLKNDDDDDVLGETGQRVYRSVYARQIDVSSADYGRWQNHW